MPDDLREAVEGGEWREMALREPVIQEVKCVMFDFFFLLVLKKIDGQS